MGDVRRRGSVGRGRDGDRRRRGPRVRHRRKRRDREGRVVFPADGQEAPARARGGRAEPAAVHLPRRLRRRVPAATGRGLSRPRPLRADLLQPGAHVGARHPADRGRDGLVHGGRRVRPRDERRDRDRARHGHDLHRRPATREGRDRPGRHRRRARRRRRPRAAIGGRRPLRDLGRACARDRAADRRRYIRAKAGTTMGGRGARAAGCRPVRAVRPRPRRPSHAARSARGDRADRRRLALRRVQGALR